MNFSVVLCRTNPSTGLPEHMPLPIDAVPRVHDTLLLTLAGVEFSYLVTEVKWCFRACPLDRGCEVVVIVDEGVAPALRSATLAARHTLLAALKPLPAFERFRVDVGALPELAGKTAACSWLTTFVTLQDSLRASVVTLDEYGSTDPPGLAARKANKLALKCCEITLESLLRFFDTLLDERFPATTGSAS